MAYSGKGPDTQARSGISTRRDMEPGISTRQIEGYLVWSRGTLSGRGAPVVRSRGTSSPVEGAGPVEGT